MFGVLSERDPDGRSCSRNFDADTMRFTGAQMQRLPQAMRNNRRRDVVAGMLQAPGRPCGSWLCTQLQWNIHREIYVPQAAKLRTAWWDQIRQY